VAILVNTVNNHEVNVSNAGLWCFLFGCFYLAYKGVWGHAILAFILACCTCGISWLIYPFFAGKVIIDHYMKAGYKLEE
jgi:hypothetical protein